MIALLIVLLSSLAQTDEGILPDVFSQQCFGTLSRESTVVVKFAPTSPPSNYYELTFNDRSRYLCQSGVCKNSALKNFLVIKLKPNGNLVIQRFDINPNNVALEKISNVENMKSGTAIELIPLSNKECN